MIKNISIFVDFDGTIAQQDVGDELFKKFGTFEPYNSQLKNGDINIHKYWKILCNSLPPDLNLDILYSFIDKIDIDPYFIDFANYTKENSFPITILSDGFDIYIDRILNNNSLQWINFYSNKLKKSNNNNFTPIFPGASESCKCFCASCKRNKLLNLSNDDDIIVYIGDGYSDFCCANHSDIIFAKKSLASYCNENKIPHYPFKTFFDVKRIMIDFIKKNKYKKRNLPTIQTKRAFESE